MSGPGLGAFSHVTLGVAHLDEAAGFWQRNFGLDVRDRREGPDAAVARLWGIAPERITRQAIVATPTGGGGWAAAGNLHLVEFTDPLPPVRRGAQAYDRLPKNLDLYTVDMATRYAELESAGIRFRARWAEMAAGQHVFREVHLPGHDEINVVLLEVLGPGYTTPLSPKGYAGIGPLISIVGDGAAEVRFYRDVLGMTTTLELLLTGPDIERTVGLPSGAGLRLQVFGDPHEPLGRIEVIEYQQVRGEDLYPRAMPPATGILHVTYRVPDLAPLRARLAAAGVSVTEHGTVTAIFGSGPLLSFRSPAGFRIEVQG
jgi:catechol 2,3-dioxygenase-like lactoylglutathione lyase family enzyme